MTRLKRQNLVRLIPLILNYQLSPCYILTKKNFLRRPHIYILYIYILFVKRTELLGLYFVD